MHVKRRPTKEDMYIIYWYMHMTAPPSKDNVGHFFKVQKSRMMLLQVCVHVHTVCVCGHVCVCVCMYIMYVYVCAHCMHVQVFVC